MAEQEKAQGGEPAAAEAPSHAETETGAAESACEEICRRLETSGVIAGEAWEREMEVVLERMSAATKTVFSIMMPSTSRGRVCQRLVHFGALFGSRTVLEEACMRTPGGPVEAAQLLDTQGNMLLHLAVRNRHLSVEDIQWAVSLHAAAANTVNRNWSRPLHQLLWKQPFLSPEMVDVVLEACPQALQTEGQLGCLCLHYACLNPHITASALRRLVSLDSAAARALNQNGDLPLHLLLRHHESLEPEQLDVVLEAHPQALQTEGQLGCLCLHYACLNPHITAAALRRLVSLDSAAARTLNQNGDLPLHLLLRHHESLEPEQLDVVLEAHPQALQRTGDYGFLPLHYACDNPHMTAPVLRQLVSLHTAAAGRTNQSGELPLHQLVRQNMSLSSYLLNIVLQVHQQAVHAADQHGSLPLHHACENPHMSARALHDLMSLHAAGAQTTDNHGLLPLHSLVACHGSLTPELVDAVVETHPQALHSANRQGHLPLHYACANPRMNAPALRHLVSLHAAAAGVASNTDQFPLHQLVSKHRMLTPELVDTIVQAHPPALQSADHNDCLPLHHACLNRYMTAPALRHLLSLHTAAARARSKFGSLPLHLLLKHHELLTPEMVDAVLDAHPDALQTSGAEGFLPLHFVCSNRHLTAPGLNHLLSLNAAAAETAAQHNVFPLHLLFYRNTWLTPKLVDILLEACPRVLRTATKQGHFPLHYACLNPDISLAMLRKLLLLDSAAARKPDRSGKLPLHLLVSHHRSLMPGLIDAVVQAHPQALQTTNQQGDLPLHSACLNNHMTALALRHLVSLHADAASVPSQHGQLPLHVLVNKHQVLTPELIHIVVDAYPPALQYEGRMGYLPLHCACANRRMSAEAFRSMLRAFPNAAVIPTNTGRLPYHVLEKEMPQAVRTPLAKMLMEATDSLFPRGTACSEATTSSSASQRYVLPAADPRWASRKHPLSTQGRLKAGLHVAVRGRENAWQFQTGGRALPDSEALERRSLAELVQVGHVSLVRERLVRFSAVNVPDIVGAVRRALELDHVDAVRELLTTGPSSVQVFCTAEQACEWLGALMRRRPAYAEYGWLVNWMRERCGLLGDVAPYRWLAKRMGAHLGIWGSVNLDWLCLGAAALSGRLSMVESMGTAWQMHHNSGSDTDEMRMELADRAIAGGNVAVLRWLQDVGLASRPTRTREAVHELSGTLAKHDYVEMVEFLHRECEWSPDIEAGRVAVESGAVRMLRWLHVHFCVGVGAGDMAAAIRYGHPAVVHFLRCHHNITHASQGALADAVWKSAPETLSVVEYVLRHNLWGGRGDPANAVTWDVVLGACVATTVRVEVVRYLVSRASEDVLRTVEEELVSLEAKQAQDVLQAARVRASRRSPSKA